MKTVRLTHLDGKLPNLALMKLASWHRQQGDDIRLERRPTPTLFEPSYDVIYASAVFEWTRPVIDRLLAAYPEAIVGGTGTGDFRTVEEVIGCEHEQYDYSIYPGYRWSLGFTQRGCRQRCGFCVVPRKEGKPRAVNTVWDIWRGDPHPRAVLLLDNDFFGLPSWSDRIAELRDGKFRVSFNQGINLRLLRPEQAAALAQVEYRDDDFERRRLYTAWDNLGDEARFFKGLALLNDAGVPSKHLMVYMLIGYRPGETMEEIIYRFERLRAIGVKPFPMVYQRHKAPAQLRRFARWVIRRYYHVVPWEDFRGAV